MGNNGDLAQHVLSILSSAHTVCQWSVPFCSCTKGKRKKAADYVAQDRIAFSTRVRREEEKGCRLRMLKSQLHSCSTTYFGRSLRGKTELLSSILNSTEIKEYLLKRSKRGLLSTDRAASVILPAPLFSTFVKNLRSLMSFPRDHTILIFRSI